MTFEKINPPGCNWPKPPGCHCRMLEEARGCENRCDDSMFEPKGRRFPLVIAFAVVLLLATCVKSHSAPAYCKALQAFERSCVGVRAAVKVFGRNRAEWIARKCGATPEELRHANECLAPISLGTDS